MSTTRDANLGAGIESGLSSKERISQKNVLAGKTLPEGVTGAWKGTKGQKMSRGHTFKNG